MNKERILALADLIETKPFSHEKYDWENFNPAKVNGFNMEFYRYDCGTPSCIAGWAASASLGHPEVLPGDLWASKAAANWLELDHEWAKRNVFEPCGPLEELHPSMANDFTQITPKMAAGVLRRLAEHEAPPSDEDMADLWDAAIKEAA